MRYVTLLVAVLLCLSIGREMEAGVVTNLTIVDRDMRPADWAVINKHSPVLVSDSRFVNTEALRIFAGGQFWSAIYRQSPVWDPATLGMIDQVSLTMDVFVDGPVLFAPVLVQGQTVYAPPGRFPYFREPGNFGVSQRLNWNLPISLYAREVGVGPGRPDFSAGATPIQLGVAVRRDAGGQTLRFGNVGFDVTGSVAAVPEPQSLSIVAIGVLSSLVMRRRSRQGSAMFS